MTVESVIDMSDEPERVRFVDTCLVEGPSHPPCAPSSVKFRPGRRCCSRPGPRVDDVPAQGGAQPCSREAQRAGGPGLVDLGAGGRGRRGPRRPARARPPPRAPRGTFDAEVTVNGADGRPELMALGITRARASTSRPATGRRHSGGRGPDRYAGKRNTTNARIKGDNVSAKSVLLEPQHLRPHPEHTLIVVKPDGQGAA